MIKGILYYHHNYIGGVLMPRINLSIDQELFDLLKDAADEQNCTVNVHIISILERLYKQNPFDYQAALSNLIEETKFKSNGEEFTLVDLPSFSEISTAKAEDAKIKPSIVRARLGKLFNAAVSNGNVPFIKRAKKENGELKFSSRAAVYIKSIDVQND
jgi:hypothetical protein